MKKIILFLLLMLNVACVLESDDKKSSSYKEYWYNDLYARIDGDKIELHTSSWIYLNDNLVDEDDYNPYRSFCRIKRSGVMTYKDENKLEMRVDKIELLKAGDENGDDGEYCEIYIENQRTLQQNNNTHYFELIHRDLMNYILNS